MYSSVVRVVEGPAVKECSLCDTGLDFLYDFVRRRTLRRLFVRCERQTLVKLPNTGAVQFTIRTYVRPLREYLGKPVETLERLRHAIAEMPDIWVSHCWH